MKQLMNNSKQTELQGIKEWEEKMSDGEGNGQRCTKMLSFLTHKLEKSTALQ